MIVQVKRPEGLPEIGGEQPAPLDLRLPTARFRFSIRVKTLMVLPPYKGGIFRGAFGATFRRIVCVLPKVECNACILREKCLYVSLFAPPAPAHFPDAAKYSSAPPPYVLNPPLSSRQVFRADEIVSFELVLIGGALDALPYFIFTFMEMGKRGLGRDRGRYEIADISLLKTNDEVALFDPSSQTLRAIPPEEPGFPNAEDNGVNTVTLTFLTPLRIKEKGRLVAERLTFPLFFERLHQRLALLTAFYGTGDSVPDLSAFQDRAEKIKTGAHDLHWYEWGRYSMRQKEAMKLGGLKGKITFKGELGPFMPFLRMGEKVNVGQGTSFGLGRYEIATPTEQ